MWYSAVQEIGLKYSHPIRRGEEQGPQLLAISMIVTSLPVLAIFLIETNGGCRAKKRGWGQPQRLRKERQG